MRQKNAKSLKSIFRKIILFPIFFAIGYGFSSIGNTSIGQKIKSRLLDEDLPVKNSKIKETDINDINSKSPLSDYFHKIEQNSQEYSKDDQKLLDSILEKAK